MVNLRMWPSIIGGFVAMGFNWANVTSISSGTLMPASLHISGFLTGYLIVFTSLTITDMYRPPRIFRKSFYMSTEKNNETISKPNTKPSYGESNK